MSPAAILSTLKRASLATVMALVVLLAGCGSGTEEAPAAPESESPAEEAAVEEQPVGNFPLAGRVVLNGPIPERNVIEYNDECREFHDSEPLLSDATIISDDGGVKFAVAYISDPPEADYPIPTEPASINQLGCRYEPHVIAYRAGQVLEVHNSDPFTHNVRSFAKENRRFNMGQPADTPARTKTYEKPEMEVKLKCDVHPWMKGFMFVMDHPFFAVTDENGNFEFPEIAAGDYTLVVWHEEFGQQEIPLTIDGTQGELQISFETD